MFMVLSSWHSHCESSPGSFDECRLSAGWPPTLRPNQPIWAVRTPIGCYHLQTLSPFIVITQLVSWYSFYRPTECGLLLCTVLCIFSLCNFGRCNYLTRQLQWLAVCHIKRCWFNSGCFHYWKHSLMVERLMEASSQATATAVKSAGFFKCCC